ncbi:MAG TPA: hypothetical protein VFA44_06750 [Gaiellaceae bacterium]|nr:hypothetical protein [Gaiellaceae bacterium]
MGRLAAIVLVFLLVLAVAACGGGGKKAQSTPATSTSAAHRDPGKAALASFLEAAKRHDAAALWGLLSSPSRERLGPSLALFRRTSAATIEQALVPFERGGNELVLSRPTGPSFGLVAIRSGVRALAVPLRKEGSAWKIETPGPITIDISGPQPGSSGPVGKVAVELHGVHGVGEAGLFLDGSPLGAKVTVGRGSATVYANLAQAAPAGLHVAVAYAQFGRNVSALAWTFRAA